MVSGQRSNRRPPTTDHTAPPTVIGRGSDSAPPVPALQSTMTVFRSVYFWSGGSGVGWSHCCCFPGSRARRLQQGTVPVPAVSQGPASMRSYKPSLRDHQPINKQRDPSSCPLVLPGAHQDASLVSSSRSGPNEGGHASPWHYQRDIIGTRQHPPTCQDAGVFFTQRASRERQGGHILLSHAESLEPVAGLMTEIIA